jgi:predicted 2-oxoglutarate/Fe(II)-dependent dioxygenase YbiX
MSEPAEALAELRRAANAGDIAAIRRLGKRLTAGRDAPFAPQEGVALLTRGMELGDPEATAILATLTGAGAWTEQSWPRALDLLLLAAERGSADARAQLGMLSDRPGTGDWKMLRDGVVLERWIVPPVPRQISEAPRVWTVQNFATAEICDWIIAKARGRTRRAMVGDAQSVRIDQKRTNSSFGMDIVESGLVALLLRFRIMGITSVSVTHMEPPNILHYAEGEEFAAHYDWIAGAGPEGNRLATFLLYLNDDYDGGELAFLKTGLRHKGARGDGVFFANLLDGKPDPLTLHAGLPVIRGEKWLLSQWIRGRPYSVASG